jgi:hypothetical protein
MTDLLGDEFQTTGPVHFWVILFKPKLQHSREKREREKLASLCGCPTGCSKDFSNDLFNLDL